MSLYHHTQLCGDPAIKFRRDGKALFCTIDGSLTMEAEHIRALAAALDEFEGKEAAPVSEVARMRDALECLASIHDRNPSDAMAGMTDVGYARHMLGEARSIARDALRVAS